MINKDITLANGTIASCHVLKSVSTTRPFDFIRMVVLNYASEAALTAGAPYVYSEEYTMSADGVTGLLHEAAEAWMVSAAGPLAGGEIATDQSFTIAAAQDRAWERIKRARDAAEVADFTCDGHVYKGDRERITGTVLGAKLALDMGVPFSTEYTLSNDEPITLDAGQMIAVGFALLANIEAVFARGRAKRIAVYGTTSVAAADAITWNSVEP